MSLKWLISVESGGSLMGSFANSYTLGTDNKGIDAPSMADLLALFGSNITKGTETINNIEYITYTLVGNITIDNNNKDYFPIPIEDGVIFDGGHDNGFTITCSSSSNWSGLFSPVSGTSSSSKTFIVKNNRVNI